MSDWESRGRHCSSLAFTKFWIDREASPRTSRSSSLSAARSVGICALGGGPIRSNAASANPRILESLSLSDSINAGTATFASGPIIPKAWAAAPRTSPSSSRSCNLLVSTDIPAFALGPIIPKAVATKRRTSVSSFLSSNTSIKVGTAISASGPILASAMAAYCRTTGSTFFNIEIKPGTAHLPIFPSSPRADWRVTVSPSVSFRMSAGTACSTSCVGSVRGPISARALMAASWIFESSSLKASTSAESTSSALGPILARAVAAY